MAEWISYEAAICALSLAVGTMLGFCVGVSLLLS